MSSMKTVVLATNNAHKVSEIKTALDIPGWEFKTLREMGIESDPEETAESFEGNARIKAQAARDAAQAATGKPVAALADDSGLVVDALDGAPGVHSARYASTDGKDADDNANNAKLLSALSGVTDDKRTAQYQAKLAQAIREAMETRGPDLLDQLIGETPRLLRRGGTQLTA